MADLLKLSVYVRKLITNEGTRDYLAAKFPDLLRRFDGIVFENDSREPITAAG